MTKNATAQPMAVPATHVLAILALATDVTVTLATATLVLVSPANANKERKF